METEVQADEFISLTYSLPPAVRTRRVWIGSAWVGSASTPGSLFATRWWDIRRLADGGYLANDSVREASAARVIASMHRSIRP